MRDSVLPCLLFRQDGHVAQGEDDSGATVVGGGGGGGPEGELAANVFSGRASSCYLWLVYRAMRLTRFMFCVCVRGGGREGGKNGGGVS